MYEEEKLKEEIYKCSKCGLCQCVCPVYLATRNEMFLSRGRYNVLNGFYNYGKKLSKNFIDSLDVCLNCNACKDFCPSNIDAYKVFSTMKNKYNYRYSIFYFSFIYKCILIFCFISSLLYKIFPFKSLLLNTCFEKMYAPEIIRKKTDNSLLKKGNVIYFEGCFNKYINNSDKNASLNIIEKLGYKVTNIISLCCGYPYLNEGNFKSFINNANKIINIVNDDCDYIVCSCDSCFDTLKRISSFIVSKKAEIFVSKLIRLDEFLKLNNASLSGCQNFLYYKPLIRKEECYISDSVKEYSRKGLCSLMENFFILKYPKYSKLLIKSVFLKKEDVDGKTIVTSCLLAKLGFIIGLKRIHSIAHVLSYAEYAEKNLVDD